MLGSVMLKVKLGQALGSFTGSKVDGHKSSPGDKEEQAVPTTTMHHSLDSLNPNLPYPRPLGAELAAPCSLFSYPAVAQHSPTYQVQSTTPMDSPLLLLSRGPTLAIMVGTACTTCSTRWADSSGEAMVIPPDAWCTELHCAATG